MIPCRGMRKESRNKSAAAFTLIELLVVASVIVILASLALPVFTTVQERARITQDLNNLRQLGIGAQVYLNDHDDVLFATDQVASPWMAALHPKYLPSWKIFQSPFDGRAPLENNTTSPISYGLNRKIRGILKGKIQRQSAFILFAPAQNSGASVTFTGTAASGVTVLRATSLPGGTAVGGTQNKRKRINALFADLHSEGLSWATFTEAAAGGTPLDDSNYRWDTGP